MVMYSCQIVARQIREFLSRLGKLGSTKIFEDDLAMYKDVRRLPNMMQRFLMITQLGANLSCLKLAEEESKICKGYSTNPEEA